MVTIKTLGSIIRKSKKYVVNFQYSQNYSFVIINNKINSLKKIKALMNSKDYFTENVELYEQFSEDDLKFDISEIKISKVKVSSHDDGGEITRDIDFTVVISIYNFESLNNVANENWGLSLNSDYEDDDQEADDVSTLFSNLVTGFYVNESNDDYEIEWSDQDGKCELILKLSI